MNALVSIVIPSYNKSNYISETIYSVTNQTYKNWELLIVDDCSTDSTIEILTSFEKSDKRIKIYVNEKNSGANFSRNFAMQMATGSYIMFLDADDLLQSDCLSNRLKYMENTDYDFCVFTMGTFYNKIGDSSSLWRPASANPLADFLKHELPWSILQPIWKKEFLIKLGGFDLSFQRLQDVEMHTRALLKQGVNFKQINSEPDCYYRIDDARKNYNTFEFLSKWMVSTDCYINKMKDLVKKSYKKYIFSTLLKSHQQLSYNLKINKISKTEFFTLENILFSNLMYRECNLIKKKIFIISRIYNSSKIRIPGLNKLLNILITL